MLCTVRLQDKSCEHLALSCFDILARFALPASKRILELAKYITELAIVFFSFLCLCGEKIHGKGPWSFLQYREKSELEKSASEDKDPKKLNLWCAKSIFMCLIAVGGTLPSTVCQVQLLHLRESPCFLLRIHAPRTAYGFYINQLLNERQTVLGLGTWA